MIARVLSSKSISPQRFLGTLLGIALVLVFMHLLGEWLGPSLVMIHFDMGEESTVPTWWSSVQLLLLAVLLVLLAITLRREGTQGKVLWVAALAFAFFSVDEVVMIHESITGFMKRFEAVPRFPGDYGIWILVYGVVGLVLLVWAIPGLVALRRRYRRESIGFAIGALIFIGGGVGVELVGYFTESRVLLEESMEIVGVAIMAWAVYRALYPIEVSVEIGRDLESQSATSPAVRR